MPDKDRKKVSEPVHYYLDWRYSVTIEKMKRDLEILEELGATSIEIEIDHGYCDIDPSLSIRATRQRLETDDEYNKRIKIEEERLEESKKRDLAQLEYLQKKYKKGKS